MQMQIDASKGRGDEARVERVQRERIGAGEESMAAAFGAVVRGKGSAVGAGTRAARGGRFAAQKTSRVVVVTGG